MNHGPFLHSGRTSRDQLRWTGAALLPLGVLAGARFPAETIGTLLSASAAACLTDAALRRGRPHLEGALVTGLILACMLPLGSSWWLAALGGGLAVGIGKHAFGGRRRNPFNPAALSRAFLMALLPARLLSPGGQLDGLTAATPLAREAGATSLSPGALLFGPHPGTLAEVAPLAVLLGGLLLIFLRVIDWRVPLTYLSTVCFLSLVLPGGARLAGHAPWLVGQPAVHLLAGGTLLTAFFLLTDPVTSPLRPGGRIVFAAVAGAFTMFVRLHTPYPDGAALAVLVANALVKRIDRTLLWTTSPSTARPGSGP